MTENRLQHIAGVARKCYEIAKAKGLDERFCRKMWVTGWNLDIGYEFAEKQTKHPQESFDMLSSLIGDSLDKESSSFFAIKEHGKIPGHNSIEWQILNIADLLIDSKGDEVNITTRLNYIKTRYGEQSHQYTDAIDLAVFLGLIDRVSNEVK